MRTPSVGMPSIATITRAGATSVLTALAVAAGSLAPTQAHAAESGVAPGRYENTSSAITYVGTWTQKDGSTGDSGSYQNLAADGSASLTFAATGVSWVTRVNNFSGIADVYLDGVKKSTVDLYSADAKGKQAVYSVAGLADGTHTLKVVRTGTANGRSTGKNVTVDYFDVADVDAPSAPTGLAAAKEGTGARLTWTASPESDVAGYNVYRATGSGSATKVSGSVVAGVSYLDDGLAPGTAYTYTVSAVDKAGNESPKATTAGYTTTLSAVDQGTYENDSTAVTLNGTWSTVASNQDSGGGAATLTSATGYAELSFKTSGIRWITRLNSYSGIADVYLDGVKKASVDLYAASTATQQVGYEVTGLAETTHTLRIVKTGTKNASSSSPNIMLDAFVAPDVHAPDAPTGLKATTSGNDVKLAWSANDESDLKGYQVFRTEGGTRTKVTTVTADATTWTDAGRTPGTTYGYDVVAVDTSDNASGASNVASATIGIAAQGAGTYENDSSAVTLNGSWTSTSSSMDSGGSYTSLNSAGYAEVSFKTSGIRWISRLNSYSGIADVYIDGVKKASVDLYSSTTKYQQTAYEVTGLPETAHTLRVVRTGTKNAGSTSPAIVVDSFVAPDIYPPAAPSSVVATPGKGSVKLTWEPSLDNDVVGYRVYRGDATGALGLITPVTVASTSYVDDGLQPGAAYRYQVSAVDAGGNETVSGVVGTTTVMNPVAAGTYEDDNAELTMKGAWTKTASTGANTDSGGSFASLGDTGFAELSFATSGIRWLARTNSSSGTADVYLDGVKKATVDLYSASTKYAQNVYEVSGLSETGHTLRIVRTGNKNTSSSGRNITLDALVAPDIYAPSAPTGLAAAAARTGARLTWTKSPETDVASYRVLRRAAGSSTDVLVGTTAPDTTSFVDVGLADGASYTWSVVARDTSANDSPASAGAAFTNGADPYAGFAQRYATCPTATTTVSTRAQLLSAIGSATAGTVIRLAPGSYGANFEITTKATPDKPLWICGPRTAVIDNADVTKGYGLRVNGASNVVLAGMTVRNVQKGVAVLYSRSVTVADLRIENIGDEAVHLKNQTTDSTVIGNSIATTGLNSTNYGEGVYIGTAAGNLCLYNSCDADTSDRNVIAFNDIRGTSAEAIEAKGTTTGGTIWKNTMDGAAITSSDSDSLVQILGNSWVVAGNTGTNTPADAIQVWSGTDNGAGTANIVYGNSEADTFSGYIVRMPFVDGGNVVGCDNTAPQAALGMSNKTCQA